MRRWYILFRKYLAAGVIWFEWFSLPRRDSNLSVVNLLVFGMFIMSYFQAVLFSLGRNNMKWRMYTIQPSMFCIYLSYPPPSRLCSERVLSLSSGSYDNFGENIVYMNIVY